MSVPRIDASGCGYLHSYQGSAEGWREWEEDGRTTQCRLRNQVQAYPTPRVSDGNGPGEHGTDGLDLRTVVARGGSTPQTWATPRSGKTTSEKPETWQKRKDRGDVATMPLGCQVDLAERSRYATPRAEDSQCCGNHPGQQDSLNAVVRTAPGGSTPPTYPTPTSLNGLNAGSSTRETAAIFQEEPQILGSLNPEWVEWLMGWPRGWTDCEHSVTDRCLNAWRRRSRTWLRRLGYD
jgi:hypothetical protein